MLAVKGAELLDKYVGESERAVRELFRRAPTRRPPWSSSTRSTRWRRGAGSRATPGVADRVVAALLTELDGARAAARRDRGGRDEPARADRPRAAAPRSAGAAGLRAAAGRRARADILRAAGRNTPLAPDVDLTELGAELDGYSAADCAAVLREAALTAMRESLQATEVTAAHIAAARAAVPPSLDPAQLAALEAYAERPGARSALTYFRFW